MRRHAASLVRKEMETKRRMRYYFLNPIKGGNGIASNAAEPNGETEVSKITTSYLVQ